MEFSKRDPVLKFKARMQECVVNMNEACPVLQPKLNSKSMGERKVRGGPSQFFIAGILKAHLYGLVTGSYLGRVEVTDSSCRAL